MSVPYSNWNIWAEEIGLLQTGQIVSDGASEQLRKTVTHIEGTRDLSAFYVLRLCFEIMFMECVFVEGLCVKADRGRCLIDSLCYTGSRAL